MRDEDAPAATESALAKEDRLTTWLRAGRRVLVGFSGGVDSAYLTCVATEVLGPDRLLAVIGRSASYPEEQWATARRVAGRFGVPGVEVETAELDDPRYAANPSNRCYFCKSELWSKLTALARANGFDTIIDGTNADDAADYRPGARAGREYGVYSPLLQVGLTKGEIRALSRPRGIPTWAQPSSPCLSSRLPYGTPVTIARLRAVERAEAALRALGVAGDLRVRYYGDLARVELAVEQLPYWTSGAPAAALSGAVRSAGFARVEIDPRGYRSGSLNMLAGA